MVGSYAALRFRLDGCAVDVDAVACCGACIAGAAVLAAATLDTEPGPLVGAAAFEATADDWFTGCAIAVRIIM